MAESQTPAGAGVDPQRGPAQPDAPTVGANGTAPAAPGDGAPASPAERIAELEAALAAAKAEAAGNWDKFLRERADMDNFKRRTERVHAEQGKRDRKTLLGTFLTVLDNLERAISYQSSSGREVDVENLMTGLRLTQSQFRDLLTNQGVTELSAVGEAFDPAKHEAVATVVAADKPEGQVVEELQKGYLYGDELLRPARVRVSTKG
jgi:molecular chaperone GrpE